MISFHPFPARMAPDLALERTQQIANGSVVLDPMAGSGTVLRQAAASGCRAVGFDLDPLAVLMTKVATTPCQTDYLEEFTQDIVDQARAIDGRSIRLDWIDGDPETSNFIDYWFAPQQRLALRKLAKVINSDEFSTQLLPERNVAYLAMSRLIVTKEQRASLARDTSRSRPHKVTNKNDFDVFEEFTRSFRRLKRLLEEERPTGSVKVEIGDARNMTELADGTIDEVISSPPYLNAIDYIRGHRMSLVWMGYSISQLRSVRSTSVGAEKGPDGSELEEAIANILPEFGHVKRLPSRYLGMIKRYAQDLNQILGEVARVLKPSGRATYIVGNSCLKGVFINNSHALAAAAANNELILIDSSERELPASSRSLPMTNDKSNALSKRMRTECVMTFERNKHIVSKPSGR